MGEISDHTATRIFDLLNDIHKSMGRTETNMATMAKSIERIDHTVHGNGEPGLDEKVRELERNQRRATSAMVQAIRWLMPAALTLMAAGALVWLKDSLGIAPAPPAKAGELNAKEDTP